MLLAYSLHSGHCVSYMSRKTFSVSGTLKLMSFGLLLPLFGCKILSVLLIHVLDSGGTDELERLEKEKHNYGYLLCVTIPHNSALLVVKATLKDLAAYSADYIPPEALDTWPPTYSHGLPQLPSLTCSQLSNC